MKEILTIGELLLRTTVLINIKKEETLTSGTGFLFYSHENIFLVTNRHVVEKSREIELKFYGQDNFLVIKNNFITSLQYDIAICILNNIPSSAKMLTPNQIPNRKQTENFDAIEDILFIGYPTGIYDTYNNSPIARKGITATPISLNYEGKYQFLIDARQPRQRFLLGLHQGYGGLPGSPVRLPPPDQGRHGGHGSGNPL